MQSMILQRLTTSCLWNSLHKNNGLDIATCKSGVAIPMFGRRKFEELFVIC